MKSVIRLLTCGSVDDGKSTLIGRLLTETNSIPLDTLEATRTTRRTGSLIPLGDIDFSLLTDGLEAEREQGITIDVAYRSMNLSNGRRLILSDAPGHETYTRNMAVAASRADLSLVLIDATKGVRDQTRRHIEICRVMGVRHILIVVNKMDVLNFSQSVFDEIKLNVLNLFSQSDDLDISFMPASALLGIGLTKNSEDVDWYSGPTLIEFLENFVPANSVQTINSRMDVQLVLRTDRTRAVAGTIKRGQFRVGDRVRIFPSGDESNVNRIYNNGAEVELGNVGQAVALELLPDSDVSRGSSIVSIDSNVQIGRSFRAKLIWLHEDSLVLNRSYLLIAGAIETPAVINKICSKRDLGKALELPSIDLNVNEIGEVELFTDLPLQLEKYSTSKEYGNFILVDRLTKSTVAGGMITDFLEHTRNIVQHQSSVTRQNRESLNGHSAKVIWLTGLSGSGKSTIANEVSAEFLKLGKVSYVLDGDNLRTGLNIDLGFAVADRAENVRRVSEVAKLFLDAGIITIVALVSPFESDRNAARQKFQDGDFVEVFVDTPLEICKQRDPKGLYSKAKDGKIANFTGMGQSYEIPTNPDLVLDGTQSIKTLVAEILSKIFSISV